MFDGSAVDAVWQDAAGQAAGYTRVFLVLRQKPRLLCQLVFLPPVSLKVRQACEKVYSFLVANGLRLLLPAGTPLPASVGA